MVISISVDSSKAVSAITVRQKRLPISINAALTKARFLVESEIKQSVAGQRSEPTSVDTGRFLNSISSEQAKNVAVIFSNVDYSIFLEKGTTEIAPRRHFENSTRRKKAEVITTLKGSVIKVMR